MRVIAGSCRGRRLQAPQGLRTRPILDRVKASLFDWLGARLSLPGRLPPGKVLDLFCGSGSLGIEALSRGAASCLFAETDPAALASLQQNLDTLGLQGKASTVSSPAEKLNLRGSEWAPFDLAFLDPPYSLNEDLAPGSVLGRVLARLGGEIPVAPGALLVWRYSANRQAVTPLVVRWRLIEERSWGKMAIALFEYVGPQTESPGDRE